MNGLVCLFIYSVVYSRWSYDKIYVVWCLENVLFCVYWFLFTVWH